MGNRDDPDRWARLRFAVIGSLLAAPPAHGELMQQLLALSTRRWRHPVKGSDIYFSVSTIERWFYAARQAADPVFALR
ncbi:MAG: IS481 family transposase, partial [Gammaproteobacteria bacterium]|nr:IS481 family transposase [Gammaproteobacteria bacterium]